MKSLLLTSLIVLGLIIVTMGYACAPFLPEIGSGKCFVTCPNGKIIDYAIPKEALDFCQKKLGGVCECTKLTKFFARFMKHIAWSEDMQLLEKKCLSEEL